MLRQCFFCSSNANSLEDAWPRWITSQFKGCRPSEVQAERGGVSLKSWSVNQPELPVRCVCKSCNNGWMSQLEVQAKPFLQPLLTGESRELDILGQTIVTRWSLKTAMVLEALDQAHKRAYTQIERERLRSFGAIPWRTSVWLAASIEPSWFMSSKNSYLGAMDTQSILGMSITMAFAHMVLQVLTIRVPEAVGSKTQVTTDVRRGPWDKATIQIWPPQSTLVTWPPSMGLNDENGLYTFSERFNTSTQDSGPIDRLVI
jgi:hypothetical protein